MSDIYCEKHEVKKQVYGGCSAHPDNWYCQRCDEEKELNDNWCDGCNPDNCTGCSNTKEGRLDIAHELENNPEFIIDSPNLLDNKGG